MKIRSNAQQAWSIMGFTLTPGQVVEAPTDQKLLLEIKRLITNGYISVVEAEDAQIAPTITRVDTVAEKVTTSTVATPSLLDPNKIIISNSNSNLDINIVESSAVESGTEILMEPIVEATNLEYTKSVTPVENTTVVATSDSLESRIEMGEILVPGDKPGETVAKNISDSIAESTNAIQEVLKETAKELENLAPKNPIVLSIPERTQKIYEMNPNKRKLEICKIVDIEFLKEIANNTENQKIQKLINQRLEELK